MPKTENKSFFMYTALIFFAAIVIIVVAFFGQSNLERSKSEIPIPTAEPQHQSGITQKATEISAENAWLKTENTRLTKENEELSSRKTELEINYSNGNKFCNIYQFINEKNIDDAIITFNSINPDSLTEEQKIIYNNLLKILK